MTTMFGFLLVPDVGPFIAAVISSHDVPVQLHEVRVGTRGIHREPMDAIADLGVGIGEVFGFQPAVDRLPCRSAIVGAKRSGSGDRHIDPLRIRWIKQNRVQTHASRPRSPLRSGAVSAQARQFVPVLPTVGGLKNRRIFHSRVDGIGIGQ